MITDIIKSTYHIIKMNFTRSSDSLCKFYTIQGMKEHIAVLEAGGETL